MDLESLSEEELEFLRFYGALMLNRNKGHRIRYNKFFYDPDDADIMIDVRDLDESERDYEHTMIIEIGESAFQELIHLHQMYYHRIDTGAKNFARQMLEKSMQEQILRDRHPSVKQAWEQYSLMLHLASNGNING